MLDNFKTGGNEPPFLFSLYEIYCTATPHAFIGSKKLLTKTTHEGTHEGTLINP